jgi:carboxylesterase type B
MIWVHGGGYVDGQGMAYDGSSLSVTGDVIVVTINYRLNIFGFFATSDGLKMINHV